MHILTILIISLFTLYSNRLTSFTLSSLSLPCIYSLFSFFCLHFSNLTPLSLLSIYLPFFSSLYILISNLLTLPPSLSHLYTFYSNSPHFLFLFASLDICTPNFSVFLVNEFILQVSMNKCFLTAPLLQPCIRLRSIK